MVLMVPECSRVHDHNGEEHEHTNKHGAEHYITLHLTHKHEADKRGRRDGRKNITKY